MWLKGRKLPKSYFWSQMGLTHLKLLKNLLCHCLCWIKITCEKGFSFQHSFLGLEKAFPYSGKELKGLGCFSTSQRSKFFQILRRGHWMQVDVTFRAVSLAGPHFKVSGGVSIDYNRIWRVPHRSCSRSGRADIPTHLSARNEHSTARRE